MNDWLKLLNIDKDPKLSQLFSYHNFYVKLIKLTLVKIYYRMSHANAIIR